MQKACSAVFRGSLKPKKLAVMLMYFDMVITTHGVNLKPTCVFFLPPLTLSRMGFRGFSRMGGPKKPPVSKICHRYSTMMKVGIVIPYLRKTPQKI